jgi:hypothetical protein
MKDRISVRQLSDADLVTLLKDLQRRFDAGPPTQELLEILHTFIEAYDELKRRGHSELQIEWMLHDKPLA